VLDKQTFTYCMKPIGLDVIKSAGGKMLFVVAGGQQLDEEGRPSICHACPGVFGLIVLTPNGANLGVVATDDLYEGYNSYGGYPGTTPLPFTNLDQTGRTAGWHRRSCLTVVTTLDGFQ
jgi:hypothetical protein